MPSLPPDIREEALKRMLRPLIRYCIRGAETIQYLITLLKVVYVEVAVDELEKRGEKITMSRLSVMTGVQRTDIARIYKDKGPLKPVIGDIVRRVIGQWQQDDRFTTKDGRPRVLGDAGADSEFEQLVKCVSSSVGPKPVLRELERAQVVKRTKTGVKLVGATLRSGSDLERSSRMLSRSMEALLSASQENAEYRGEDKPHLNMRTEYDNVFLRDIPKIRKWLKQEGRKFHKRARAYIAKYDRDVSASRNDPAGGRVVLGAFSYSAQPSQQDTE